MAKTWSNKYGEITITNEVIGKIAGLAAMECYGLVGMSSRNVQDGIADLLGIENLTKGLVVEDDDKEGTVSLELNIIVEYGTNIHEVAQNIIDRVTYTIKEKIGVEVSEVNVNVQGVRVGNGGK